MERAEKRTQMTEREIYASEREKFRSLKQDLMGPEWKKILLSVTAVRDPRDKTELEEKKTKTIAEIDTFLNKFGEARDLEKKLRARQRDQKEDPGVDDFSASEEEDKTGTDESQTVKYSYRHVYDRPELEKPKSQTELEDDLESFPKHNKRQTDDNLAKGDVVKRFKSAVKHHPTQSVPFVSFFANPKGRLKFDQLLKKSHRSAQAFGRPIPPMKKNVFELPNDWHSRFTR